MILISVVHEELSRGSFGTWGLVQDPADGTLKKIYVGGFKLSTSEFQKILDGGFRGGKVKDITDAS